MVKIFKTANGLTKRENGKTAGFVKGRESGQYSKPKRRLRQSLELKY